MNAAARTFTLTGLVAACLLALHLLPAIDVDGQPLRPVNILSDILPEPYQLKYGMDVIPKPEPPKPIAPEPQVETVKPFVEYRPEGVTLIDDYSEGLAGGMDYFYGLLDSMAVLDRPVRIAWFGDSFIEGDILTAHIRERLQQRFGGSGVGWVDPGNKINGFRQTVRQRFKGFTEYEVVEKPFSYRVEGINQRYFVPEEGASVWTRGTDYCPHADSWQQATLFLRTEQGTTVEVNVDDTEWTDYQLEGSDRLQSVEIRRPMHCISYRFRNVGADTYIHGMALEDTTGITLDNFSMRGSSGLTLGRLPTDMLSDLALQRPYDLIVLHFGLNVVSEKAHAANYKAHTRRMGEVVAHLRQSFPESSVLIVSVPDRNQRTHAGIRTMNGIESLVGYQQLLASDCHVAFFNLFKAMGGRESMKLLVDKQLANKDYTHLKHQGGELLSERFFDSLMAGYENYHRRKGND